MARRARRRARRRRARRLRRRARGSADAARSATRPHDRARGRAALDAAGRRRGRAAGGAGRATAGARLMLRILAIRGARLASLEAPFEVDLGQEPLRSAGVFAIVGPTGAGKSSLLDALCLALFDTTPRLERTPRQKIDGDDEGE